MDQGPNEGPGGPPDAGARDTGAARDVPPPPPPPAARDWGDDEGPGERSARGASGLGAGAPGRGTPREGPAGPGYGIPGGYGPGGYGPGGYGPEWHAPYAPRPRPPWIVGPAADQILGFVAGLFGNVLGFVAAVIVMFLWADNAHDPGDHAERRDHARGVSIWAGVGCLVPLALFAVALVGLFAVGSHIGPILTQPPELPQPLPFSGSPFP